MMITVTVRTPSSKKIHSSFFFTLIYCWKLLLEVTYLLRIVVKLRYHIKKKLIKPSFHKFKEIKFFLPLFPLLNISTQLRSSS